MKDFLKYVGATVVGLIIFTLVVAMFGIMSVAGMVASAEATRRVDDNSVLVVNLNGEMQEVADERLSSFFTGYTDLGLRETLQAVKKAKNNDNIKGIFLQAGALGIEMAQAEELRQALADFRKSGKWIVAYGDTYSQMCYYLATIANKIYVNPRGMVDWHGLGGEIPFLKDVYAKVGIKMIPFKCGKYKSATEIYTEDKMSEASREQTERYINGWWHTICKAVSTSRGISMDQLNQYADRVITLEEPKMLLQCKMVDGLLYEDEVKQAVKKLLHVDEDAKINQISVSDMQQVPAANEGDMIGVYYAYGDIVDQDGPQSMLTGQHAIVGSKMCRDLEDLAQDDDIKAVVIRVNTGGGSAYASEQIWHEIERLKKKKPVVISMGGAAASGGYYISAGAHYIYAEPTTITGSIGIFGIVRDRSELMTQKLGFKYDVVKTNRNATMGSEVTPMTLEQMEYMQASIDRGYMLFKSRVAAGRHMTMSDVEARAQGHVFLGSDARQLKLVDALGGLDEAVSKAAQLAKLKTYYTVSFPTATSLIDQLMESGDNMAGNALDEKLRTTLGSFYEPFVLMQTAAQQSGLQARMPFVLPMR